MEITFLSKVHGWALWFSKILNLVPSFPKVNGWSLWFALWKKLGAIVCTL
ncbi:hypothetical protein Hanom_Chr17g01564151 [Helianthus anomalus]